MNATVCALTFLLAGQLAAAQERTYLIELNVFAVEGVDLSGHTDDPQYWRYSFVNGVAVERQTVPTAPLKFNAESGTPEFEDDGVEVSALARPRITTQAGREARIEIGQRPVQYFERVDGDTFKLRTASAPPSLAFAITVEPGAERGGVHLHAVLDINQVTGRTPIDGIELPVGTPIVHAHGSTISGAYALGDWHVHAYGVGEQRFILTAMRITDPETPAVEVTEAQYQVETKIFRISGLAWTAIVSGSMECTEALRLLDGDMPVAVQQDAGFAAALAEPNVAPLVPVDRACVEALLATLDNGTAELLTAPRATWIPEPVANTLFKVVLVNRATDESASSLGARGGFGVIGKGGGSPSVVSDLFDFLQQAAPAFWREFDPNRDTSNRPVIIADVSAHEANGTRVYHGNVLAFRIEGTGSTTMTLRQGYYAQLEDHAPRRGILGRGPRGAAAGVSIHERTGATPVRAGQTILSAHRMPASGDVILLLATVSGVEAPPAASTP